MNTQTELEEFFAHTATKKSGGDGLRGDYEKADSRFVVQQDLSIYTEAEHDRWRRLYQRQLQLMPGRACDEFIEGLKELDAADGIPDFAKANVKLQQATGWQLVAVPGLIPDFTFFEHLANCRFPVTVWLRDEDEFNYIVEPDVFHDFFGHVPLLLNPIFAKHIQDYGIGGLRARGFGKECLTMLARLYWYTVEFGLLNTKDGLRIYGAGILSSSGEVQYCLHGKDDTQPLRIALNVERVLQTLFKIDSYQETYFVINSFQQLFDDTAHDFAPYYERISKLEAYPANTLLAGEVNISVA